MHIKWRSWLLIFLFLLVAPSSLGDRISRALKALDKGKYQRVESLVTKSLEKHKVNPGANFVLALLYFDSTYHRYHLDSAHYYIELALKQEQLTDSVKSWPLAKASLTRTTLLLQKHAVDSTAFQKAMDLNSVEDLQHFIDLYPSALQYAQAVAHRNKLAFDQASEQHTFEAYRLFMDKYPQSVQFPEAESRYHLLLFQSMTAGGRLKDYMSFLEKNPQSPYRNRAETQIYELQTLDHRPESYTKFLENFPNSVLAHKARGTLYHLIKPQRLDQPWLSDSLSQLQQLEATPLTAVFEKGRYAFMDDNGIVRIPAVYDSIPDDLLCQQLYNDTFEYFQEGRWKLTSRGQSVIWNQPYEKYQDLGQGYILITANRKLGVIHKGGWTVLPPQYDDVKLLDQGFIAFREGSYWGLCSMTGRQLLTANYQEITSEGAFIAIKDKSWAIFNRAHLIDWYRSQQPSMLFQFDDWELISPGHLLVTQGEKEGVFNEDLHMVVPLSRHEIYEVDSLSWYSKTSHGTVRFYGQRLNEIPPDRYENFLATSHYICLERSSKWELWDRGRVNRINETLYDSVARLGNHILLLREMDLTTALFPNGTTIAIGPRQQLKSIRSANQTKGFLQITSQGGLREVYNLDGERIYRTWYYDVEPLTSELLIIEKNRQKGVIDLKGQILIKARYETIVADDDDNLTLLQKGRFGYYNLKNKRLISPQYHSRVSRFNEQLLITSKNGKKGLINLQNRTVVPFDFDDIQQWSDSAVLVQKNNSFAIYNYLVKKNSVVSIKRWQWVQNAKVKLAIFRTNGHYGLIHSEKGLLLEPVYNDIINLGTAEAPLIIAERKLPEQALFQVSYYNRDFKLIRDQTLNEVEYEKLLCF